MRRSNSLKSSLASGSFAAGTWSVLPSAAAANVLAASGLDFVIIDMEHGPVSFETAEDMIRAIEGEACTPLVRVPDNRASDILRALDIGAHGVVVPHIANADDARRAIDAMYYHPVGSRGFSPYTRSAGYLPEDGAAIAKRENREVLSILMVEGLEGIKNLDSIMGVGGIDVIYIGVYDISQASGHPGNIDHPEVSANIQRCLERIKAKGLVAGCLARTPAEFLRLKNAGVGLLAYLNDAAMLFDAANGVAHNNN